VCVGIKFDPTLLRRSLKAGNGKFKTPSRLQECVCLGVGVSVCAGVTV